ncbi:MAG TPA: cache domain-containing protein, partial [Rhodocyclaceae bacterium]|nr:cache domain-containing protein [Rhodocyclaceae bacterium]
TPLIFGIEFLFGSIFAMLALQWCGALRGIAAAAAIAGYTWFAWNHLYAVIIMTAEVAVVASLVSRRKIGLVMADTLYWLVLGMPMVYSFYSMVMGGGFENTSIVMIKQSINGIANALVARLICSSIAVRFQGLRIGYRELTYNFFVFFALCPALILLVIFSHNDFSESEAKIRAELREHSSLIRQRLEVWLENRSTAIEYLAAMAATHTPTEMQLRLEQAHRSDLNYLRIGLLDKQETTVAFSPRFDRGGQSNLGLNFADRPFLPKLRQTLKPLLSEVVMSRIIAKEPTVTLSAPVVVDGEYSGRVSGALNLQQIRSLLDQAALRSGMNYTLLDKNKNIIFANLDERKPMTPFARPTGKLIRLDDAVSQWTPILPPNTLGSHRWKSSVYLVDSPIGNPAEWRLILEQPMAPFQQIFFKRYTYALGVLFALFLVAVLLAELLSRRMAHTIEQLSHLTRDLPLSLKTGAQIRWPDTGLLEPYRLTLHFKMMMESLSAQFRANRELHASLEQRVTQRTRELEQLNRHFVAFLENTTDFIYFKDKDGRFLFCSQTLANVTGHASWRDMLGKHDFDVFPKDTAQIYYEEELSIFRDGIPLLNKTDPYYDAQGKPGWVLANKWPLFDANNNVIGIFGISQDITVLKTTLEDLERSNADLEQYAYAASHDMRQPLRMISSYLQLLASELAPTLNDESRQHLDFAIDGAQRMDRMLSALLEYSRVGRKNEPMARIDSRALVDDALRY